MSRLPPGCGYGCESKSMVRSMPDAIVLCAVGRVVVGERCSFEDDSCVVTGCDSVLNVPDPVVMSCSCTTVSGAWKLRQTCFLLALRRSEMRGWKEFQEDSPLLLAGQYLT